MDELGHILREARETRGLTLAEVQEETRINTKFLEALESGQYELLPTAVHVRGFLRNYARFLHLDPEPLLHRYALSQKYQTTPVPVEAEVEISAAHPLPPRFDQPFFDPVNMEVDAGSRRDPESALRLIIIAALLVALALIANRFIPLLTAGNDGSEAITEGISEVVENVIQNVATPEAPTPATESIASPTEAIVETSRNNFGNAPPTPSPTRPPLPATLETINLRLDITERTWMEVTVDGDIVFTGIARGEDPPYEWVAEQEAKVVTGNAIGVFVTINDVQLGRMGDRGENKEEIWRTTQ